MKFPFKAADGDGGGESGVLEASHTHRPGSHYILTLPRKPHLSPQAGQDERRAAETWQEVEKQSVCVLVAARRELTV